MVPSHCPPPPRPTCVRRAVREDWRGAARSFRGCCCAVRFWESPENSLFKYLDYTVWCSNKLSFVCLARTGQNKYLACRDRQVIRMYGMQLKQVKKNLIN